MTEFAAKTAGFDREKSQRLREQQRTPRPGRGGSGSSSIALIDVVEPCATQKTLRGLRKREYVVGGRLASLCDPEPASWLPGQLVIKFILTLNY